MKPRECRLSRLKCNFQKAYTTLCTVLYTTYIYPKTTAAVVKQYNEHVEPVNQSSLSICQKHHGINYASFIKALCTRSSSRVAT